MKEFTPLLFFLLAVNGFCSGNESVRSFREAKKLAFKIHEEQPYTIYCHCLYHGNVVDLKSCGYRVQKDLKRASRLEWEHVVPAENFGRSFVEWREGVENCERFGKKFRGRKCAQTNPTFAKMESDLYNLWPEIGELNGLRQNYSMAEIGAELEPRIGLLGRGMGSGSGGSGQEKSAGATPSAKRSFGDCQVKIESRKFEPMALAKGRVARTYLYMDQAYPGHGIISNKNNKLFEAWDKMVPVDEWECKRARKIKFIQGNANKILENRCLGLVKK